MPTTGILTQAGFEGCAVSGYDKLPYTSENSEEPTLQKEGWLPVDDNPPVYDVATEYLEHAGYTVGETEVTVNYTIKQRESVIYVPTTEERLAAMEEALLMLI